MKCPNCHHVFKARRGRPKTKPPAPIRQPCIKCGDYPSDPRTKFGWCLECTAAWKDDIVMQFLGGMTIYELGQQRGVSHQRIQQIIAEHGLTREDGGVSTIRDIRANARATHAFSKRAAKDAEFLPAFGCTRGEVKALNNQMMPYNKYSMARSFINQQRAALRIGAAWDLTFPQWIKIWQDSGHLEERGRYGEGYVLTRYDLAKGFTLDNCYITTLSESSRATRFFHKDK